MSQSAVNRIENNTSDATLASAIRIMDAAETTPAEMISQISRAKPLLPLFTRDFHPIFPDGNDLSLFEALIVDKPKTTGEFFADLFNRICSKSQSEFAGSLAEMAQSSQEQQWLHEALCQPLFSGLDIFKFVLNYPSSLLGQLPFSSRINYPADMTVDLIRQAYVQHAVLHIQDIKTHVSILYNEKFSEKAKGFDFSAVKKYKEVTELKDKICDPEKIAHVRLGDIFSLDEVFSGQHELFMMACSAAQEELRPSTGKDNYRARKLMIMMSRYLATMPDIEPDWLLKFRTLG